MNASIHKKNEHKITSDSKTTFDLDEEFFENFESAHTKEAYKNDITQFFTFLGRYEKEIITLRQIRRLHIIRFRKYLQEVGGHLSEMGAPKTIGRKLAGLSSYFSFLVEKDRCDFNPVDSIKRPRHEVRNPTNALSVNQVREILDSIETKNEAGKMHKALLYTFFSTGLRKSEILNLKRQNYKELNSVMILEYRGKGGKLGQKIVTQNCQEALNDYLCFLEENGRKHLPQDWLFRPSRNPKDPKNIDKSLNPKTVNEIISHYAKKIGLPFSVCPHSARATFISTLLDAGVDIYRVAQEVNHASVTTTQEYDKRKKKLSDSPISKISY